jgi:predicted RNA-binding protein with PIN domain
MSIHIIIDGYNLIRRSKTLRHLDRQSMQIGREALVDILAAYKKIKSHKITVVFDGAQAAYLSPSRDRIRGIAVEFSRNGESADTLIQRLARKERQKALVVSSDHEVVNSAASFGAASISAEAFEKKITIAVHMDGFMVDKDDQNGWKRTTKKKGPRKRLPKRKRRNSIKIRKL